MGGTNRCVGEEADSRARGYWLWTGGGCGDRGRHAGIIAAWPKKQTGGSV
jgi:hypothetical protein